MEQEIRFCKAPDGVQIAYATVGEGEPIIKTANWLNHLEYDWKSPVWQHLYGGLARDFQLVRYDERGNGLSDWDVDDISFEAFVTDLETVVDAAGVDQFTLFGLSQGAPVSIAYALRHPQRVKRIIIHGGYARGWAKRSNPEHVELRRTMHALIEQGWGRDNPAFRQMWTSFYLPDGTPEQMDAWNELQRVSTSPENAIRIFEATGNIDVTELVPRVMVPVLVTHSRDEAAIPFSEGRWLAANLPDARLVGIDSRNHVLLGQEPGLEHFLSEVRSFMGLEPKPVEDTMMKSVPLRTGESFGNYRVENHLGTGGMGEVYQAEDTRLGRRVAIKVLPRDLASDPNRRSRFLREARALAALRHPSIITIYSVEEADDRPFLVMELVRGKTVAELLPEKGFELDRFLELAKPLAAAMAAAHEQGITHRDLKPQNVMVDEREGLKVLDFGLAKFLPTEEGGLDVSEVLTQENMAMGTLPYMSPEQVQGLKLDHRTDIFSMGVVLYEMATGKRPFRAKHPAQVITSIMTDHPPPVDLLNPTYPAGVARAISRCMEKEADARFDSATEVFKILSYS